MKRVLILFLTVFSVSSLFARDVKPLYKLPEQIVVADENVQETKVFLSGSSNGLFKISSSN